MRRHEGFRTLLISNRPADDWGKLLGEIATVSAMLDRLLHEAGALRRRHRRAANDPQSCPIGEDLPKEDSETRDTWVGIMGRSKF